MLVQCVRVVQLNYVKVQCMAYCKVGVLGLGEIGVRLILLSKRLPLLPSETYILSNLAPDIILQFIFSHVYCLLLGNDSLHTSTS